MAFPLTSHEALLLTASFAFTADRMRAADQTHHLRVSICDTASRVAFLRAHLIAKQEQMFPVSGETFYRASFAVA